MSLITFVTFIGLIKADATEKSTSTPAKIDENFSHFELKAGERIDLIEPYTSFWGVLKNETENPKYSDYRGAKFSAGELLHPLAVIVNKTSQKGSEALAENLLKKLENKNSIANEMMLTASDFFKAMETRSPYMPPTLGQIAVKVTEAATNAVANKAIIQYSEAIRVKLEVAFKEVYDKYKQDIDNGDIEKVRQVLFEKTLNTLNEFMATYYNPTEFIFKGLILGGHLQGDALKYFNGALTKVVPPIFSENGHLKISAGAILHSPRKITTVSTFNIQEILKEHTVFTVTPSLWATGRFRQDTSAPASPETKTTQAELATSKPLKNEVDRITDSAANSTAPNKINSPEDSFFETVGSIWGERDIDIGNLQSYNGVFIELNIIVMGVTLNLNQSFFFKDIEHPGDVSAMVSSCSIENNGFKRVRREELRNVLGKVKFFPNIGYVRVLPVNDYSANIAIER